jgi:hypothetical protein
MITTIKAFRKKLWIIVIEPDVAKYFTDHDSVNQALRSLSAIIKHQKNPTKVTA